VSSLSLIRIRTNLNPRDLLSHSLLSLDFPG
jgi:hypothetical protein